MAGPTICPEGMVYVSGVYEGKIQVCVDEHEFTNADGLRVAAETAGRVELRSVTQSGDTVTIIDSGDPNVLWEKYVRNAPRLDNGVAGYVFRAIPDIPASQSPEGHNDPEQPRVMLNGPEAKYICEAQGKRLLTPQEWEAVASQMDTKEYSTRTGEKDEGIYDLGDNDATRKVCEARGHYVEYSGREICDMDGNVAEWTYDPSRDVFYINDGVYVTSNWLADYNWRLFEHGFRNALGMLFLRDYSDVRLGFRCGVSPQCSSE